MQFIKQLVACYAVEAGVPDSNQLLRSVFKQKIGLICDRLKDVSNLDCLGAAKCWLASMKVL